MEKISHNGTFSTKTDFRLESGLQVRIDVWFTTVCTVSNSYTSYNCNVSTKGKGCRNWIFQFRSENSSDERIFQLISEEQLYIAYYNHWVKLNPIKIFSNGIINGEHVNFRVKEKKVKHIAFNKMKKIKELWKLLRNNAGIFKVVEDIFKFIETTHKEQKPMVTKIGLLNMATGENYGDFISLWAGIGDTNPIERVKHLKGQNTELKRLLELAKNGDLTDEDKQLIQLTLNVLE